MKCPMCDGKGMVDYPMYADDEHKWQYCVARMKKCDMCHGSGEVDMTNEEWLKSLNTEQLAEWINNIVDDGIIKAWMIKNNCCGDYLESVKWWLKQPHRGGAL